LGCHGDALAFRPAVQLVLADHHVKVDARAMSRGKDDVRCYQAAAAEVPAPAVEGHRVRVLALVGEAAADDPRFLLQSPVLGFFKCGVGLVVVVSPDAFFRGQDAAPFRALARAVQSARRGRQLEENEQQDR